jgi:hypothetical protein
MYKNRNLTIAAITMAALLGTGIFTTTSVYAGDDENKYNGDRGDSSETNTEQKLRQENIGDGTNTNCGQNLINSEGVVCFDPTDGTGDGNGNGGDGVATCDECIAAFLEVLGPDDEALVTVALDAFDCDGVTEAEILALQVALEALLLSAEADLAVADLIECLLVGLV